MAWRRAEARKKRDERARREKSENGDTRRNRRATWRPSTYAYLTGVTRARERERKSDSLWGAAFDSCASEGALVPV